MGNSRKSALGLAAATLAALGVAYFYSPKDKDISGVHPSIPSTSYEEIKRHSSLEDIAREETKGNGEEKVSSYQIEKEKTPFYAGAGLFNLNKDNVGDYVQGLCGELEKIVGKDWKRVYGEKDMMSKNGLAEEEGVTINILGRGDLEGNIEYTANWFSTRNYFEGAGILFRDGEEMIASYNRFSLNLNIKEGEIENVSLVPKVRVLRGFPDEYLSDSLAGEKFYGFRLDRDPSGVFIGSIVPYGFKKLDKHGKETDNGSWKLVPYGGDVYLDSVTASKLAETFEEYFKDKKNKYK